MRKKLKEKAGLSIVELMAVVAVMTLLMMMMGTGFQMMLNTYQTMVAKSEVELLLSTAVDALADDLRYAKGVTGKIGSGFSYSYDDTTKKWKNEKINDGFKFTSDSFGDVIELKVDVGESSPNKGQIVAVVAGDSDKRVLSTGAYGKVKDAYKEYRVTYLKITANADNTFTIHLTVEADGLNGEKITASTPKDEDGNEIGVTVRCLNPYKTTT